MPPPLGNHFSKSTNLLIGSGLGGHGSSGLSGNGGSGGGCGNSSGTWTGLAGMKRSSSSSNMKVDALKAAAAEASELSASWSSHASSSKGKDTVDRWSGVFFSGRTGTKTKFTSASISGNKTNISNSSACDGGGAQNAGNNTSTTTDGSCVGITPPKVGRMRSVSDLSGTTALRNRHLGRSTTSKHDMQSKSKSQLTVEPVGQVTVEYLCFSVRCADLLLNAFQPGAGDKAATAGYGGRKSSVKRKTSVSRYYLVLLYY